jgi:hypothetical protein
LPGAEIVEVRAAVGVRIGSGSAGAALTLTRIGATCPKNAPRRSRAQFCMLQQQRLVGRERERETRVCTLAAVLLVGQSERVELRGLVCE